MTYDLWKTRTYEEGTLEFYQEIDRRLWIAAWFAHKPGEERFSRLIDYTCLRGKRALEIGCGARSYCTTDHEQSAGNCYRSDIRFYSVGTTPI